MEIEQGFLKVCAISINRQCDLILVPLGPNQHRHPGEKSLPVVPKGVVQPTDRRVK